MRLQRLIDAYNIRMELQQEVIKKEEVAKNSIYATLSDQRDKQVSAMHSTVTKLGETRQK